MIYDDPLCPHCGTNLEVERELFGGDKLFTGHSCKGSGIVVDYKIIPDEQYLLCGIGTKQLASWLEPNTYLCSSVYGHQPAPLPHQVIGRN